MQLELEWVYPLMKGKCVVEKNCILRFTDTYKCLRDDGVILFLYYRYDSIFLLLVYRNKFVIRFYG